MNRLTDYGLVLLTHLAAGPVDQLYNARELSESVHLPLPMVSKILKVLTREGFLVSQRGARGGYSLAGRPEDVTVVAVIDALEGPIALTECGAGSCMHGSSCRVRAPWQRINHAVRRSLEGVRLVDLITPPFPSSLEPLNAQ